MTAAGPRASARWSCWLHGPRSRQKAAPAMGPEDFAGVSFRSLTLTPLPDRPPCLRPGCFQARPALVLLTLTGEVVHRGAPTLHASRAPASPPDGGNLLQALPVTFPQPLPFLHTPFLPPQGPRGMRRGRGRPLVLHVGGLQLEPSTFPAKGQTSRK